MEFYIIFTLPTMSQSHFIPEQSLPWTNPLTEQNKKTPGSILVIIYPPEKKFTHVSFNPYAVVFEFRSFVYFILHAITFRQKGSQTHKIKQNK